jgi:hypothetical protein
MCVLVSVQLLGCGLDDRGVWILFLAEAKDFSLLHSVQTSSGAHAAFYTLDTGWGAVSMEVKRQEREAGNFGLVRRSRIVHSPMSHHGVKLN